MPHSDESPPRVLIVTAGSHGDVFPFIGIGRALRAAGAKVAVLVNPYFAPDVRSASLEHLPLGERLGPSKLIRQYGLMHPMFGAFRAQILVGARDGEHASRAVVGQRILRGIGCQV